MADYQLPMADFSNINTTGDGHTTASVNPTYIGTSVGVSYSQHTQNDIVDTIAQSNSNRLSIFDQSRPSQQLSYSLNGRPQSSSSSYSNDGDEGYSIHCDEMVNNTLANVSSRQHQTTTADGRLKRSRHVLSDADAEDCDNPRQYQSVKPHFHQHYYHQQSHYGEAHGGDDAISTDAAVSIGSAVTWPKESDEASPHQDEHLPALGVTCNHQHQHITTREHPSPHPTQTLHASLNSAHLLTKLHYIDEQQNNICHVFCQNFSLSKMSFACDFFTLASVHAPELFHTVNSSGCLPLHHFCFNNYLDEYYHALRFLVCEIYGHTDIDVRDAHGRTPLMYSVSSQRSVQSISFLIQHGADVFLIDYGGNTLYHSLFLFAAKFPPIDNMELLQRVYESFGNGYLDCIESESQQTTAHNEHRLSTITLSTPNHRLQTPFALFCDTDDLSPPMATSSPSTADTSEGKEKGGRLLTTSSLHKTAYLELFLDQLSPEEMNFCDHQGEVPLFSMVSRRGNLRALGQSIKAGVDLLRRASDASTVFHYAGFCGDHNAEVFELLYETVHCFSIDNIVRLAHNGGLGVDGEPPVKTDTRSHCYPSKLGLSDVVLSSDYYDSREQQQQTGHSSQCSRQQLPYKPHLAPPEQRRRYLEQFPPVTLVDGDKLMSQTALHTLCARPDLSQHLSLLEAHLDKLTPYQLDIIDDVHCPAFARIISRNKSPHALILFVQRGLRPYLSDVFGLNQFHLMTLFPDVLPSTTLFRLLYNLVYAANPDSIFPPSSFAASTMVHQASPVSASSFPGLVYNNPMISQYQHGLSTREHSSSSGVYRTACADDDGEFASTADQQPFVLEPYDPHQEKFGDLLFGLSTGVNIASASHKLAAYQHDDEYQTPQLTYIQAQSAHTVIRQYNVFFGGDHNHKFKRSISPETSVAPALISSNVPITSAAATTTTTTTTITANQLVTAGVKSTATVPNSTPCERQGRGAMPISYAIFPSYQSSPPAKYSYRHQAPKTGAFPLHFLIANAKQFGGPQSKHFHDLVCEMLSVYSVPEVYHLTTSPFSRDCSGTSADRYKCPLLYWLCFHDFSPQLLTTLLQRGAGITSTDDKKNNIYHLIAYHSLQHISRLMQMQAPGNGATEASPPLGGISPALLPLQETIPATVALSGPTELLGLFQLVSNYLRTPNVYFNHFPIDLSVPDDGDQCEPTIEEGVDLSTQQEMAHLQPADGSVDVPIKVMTTYPFLPVITPGPHVGGTECEIRYMELLPQLHHVNKDGLSPLHVLCSSPLIDTYAIDLFRLMLLCSPHHVLNMRHTPSGETPLLTLLKSRDNIHAFRALMFTHPNIFVTDAKGNNILHYTFKHQQLQDILEVYMLLNAYLNRFTCALHKSQPMTPSVSPPDSSYCGLCALYHPELYHNGNTPVEMQSRDLINAQNQDGDTPLHLLFSRLEFTSASDHLLQSIAMRAPQLQGGGYPQQYHQTDAADERSILLTLKLLFSHLSPNLAIRNKRGLTSVDCLCFTLLHRRASYAPYPFNGDLSAVQQHPDPASLIVDAYYTMDLYFLELLHHLPSTVVPWLAPPYMLIGSELGVSRPLLLSPTDVCAGLPYQCIVAIIEHYRRTPQHQQYPLQHQQHQLSENL